MVAMRGAMTKLPNGLALWFAVLIAIPTQAAPRAQAQAAPATQTTQASAKQSSAVSVLAGTVVALDGDDLVLDLGKDKVREGATLTLYRTIEVKHPVSGLTLRDRFPNGLVRIVRAGESLSIAHPVEPPPRAALVGDKAEALASAAAPRPVAQCDECMAAQAVQRDVLDVFYRTLGKAPGERVKVMKEYLERVPETPYKTWLDYEIAYFSTALHEESARRIAQETSGVAVSTLVNVKPIEQVRSGLPVWLGVYVPPETQVRSVLLYVRQNSKTGEYQRLIIALDARGQGRVQIPAERVRPPSFAYFVEAVLPTGSTVPVLGSGTKPAVAVVRAAPSEPPRTDMSRVRAVVEYVSFDGLSGRDYYVLSEGDFLLRLHRPIIEGVRVGYGHYRGKGGTLEDLDEKKLKPASAAFTYGYLEVVLALHEMFALMPRVEVGLGRPVDETNTSSKVRGGAQLRLRIGRARGTNLVLAGESAPEIGQRAFVGLNLGLVEKWPLAFEVHVTDQPLNTNELGVRAVFEVGYRPSDVFSLSTRASYQGRTIDHAGPGLGLAATFDW